MSGVLGPPLTPHAGASGRTVAHPDDSGVLLGTVGALQPGIADAVVSLCRLGARQAPLAGSNHETTRKRGSWIRRTPTTTCPLVLRDAAQAVQQLPGLNRARRCCCTVCMPKPAPQSSPRHTVT